MHVLDSITRTPHTLVSLAGRANGPDWALVGGSDLMLLLSRCCYRHSPPRSPELPLYSFFFHVDGSLPLGKPLTTGVGRRAYYPEWPGFSIKVAIGLEVLAMPSEQIRTVVAALVEEATLRLREFAEQKRPDIAHSPLTRTVALGLADFHMIDLPEGDSPQTAQIRRLVE